MLQTLVIRYLVTLFLFIFHAGIFWRERGKMALFNDQFFTELINYINSPQNVKLCEPYICVVLTTLGDHRMF